LPLELRALSLFSGAGGMDVGVKTAGFSVLAQIEVDPYCCQTLRAAKEREKSETLVIENDIRKVLPEELMNQIGVRAGEIDLLFGGPPCQPFSLAGKRKSLSDERGPLLFEIIRFARTIRPKAILLEQVKGLLSAKGADGIAGEVFQSFLRELESLGYVATTRVLCAADYGVAQLRERLFVVAALKKGFSFPDRTHAPKEECSGLFELSPYVTAGEALAGLGEPIVKTHKKTLFDGLGNHIDVTPNRDRERIANVPEGSYLAAQKDLDSSILCGLTPKDTTKYRRLSRNMPSNTLRCGEIFFHPTENRYLTPREYLRLHGYADDYVLCGPIRARTGKVKSLDQHRQVANSAPPPLVCAIAKQIIKEM
jgi:DNA (cytosine-5)-methyltransferase 1